jgi:hypothetical protein
MPVLAAPLRALMALSRLTMLDWYWLGIAVRKAGGFVAVRADCTIELISPVMPWVEAADWTATPKGTATEAGI